MSVESALKSIKEKEGIEVDEASFRHGWRYGWNYNGMVGQENRCVCGHQKSSHNLKFKDLKTACNFDTCECSTYKAKGI